MTETTQTAPDTYDAAAIERKWQARWERDGTNHTDVESGVRPYYTLMMFLYPSAEGLHVGNLFAFAGNDVYGRYQRQHGQATLERNVCDELGVPAAHDAWK